MLDLAIQLVDGIAAVHRRGLIHGNIKPSNVFVTDEGHVKVLELGLMSAWWETYGQPDGVDSSSPTASADQRLPPEAEVDGFHSYRSPEHLAGARVDHRSDIFSIGAVLYEMATGNKAFPGDTPSRIAAAIVSGTPPPADARNPTLAAVEPILHKALEKAPENRYQSAADLLSDLRRLRRRVETSAGDTPTAGPLRRRLLLGVAAVGLVAAVAAGWWWMRGRAVTPIERHAVLIGSVANGTNDPDFDGTLRQALTVHLGQTPFLDLVSDERVRQILRMMGREPGAPLTHAVAREACERIGASALIEGSVSAVGRTTVVALSASDCTTGDTIARDQVEVEHKEDVLKAVGVIASSMRRSLGESGRSLEQHNVPIQEATTPSLDALKAFTAGVEKRAAGSEIESIPFFERAIGLDRNFALAYTTLSSIYGGLGETGRGEDYARLAYEHRSTVSERERLFITYQYHDRVTGDQLKTREALEVWKQTYPLDYRPANALALQLNRLGEYDRAIAEAPGGLAAESRAPVPVLQSRVRLSRRRPLPRGETDRRARRRSWYRNGADAPPALPARGDGQRSTGSTAPSGLGPKPAARIRSRRRASAGHGLPRTDERGTTAVSADYGGGESKSARADSERLFRAAGADGRVLWLRVSCDGTRATDPWIRPTSPSSAPPQPSQSPARPPKRRERSRGHATFGPPIRSSTGRMCP